MTKILIDTYRAEKLNLESFIIFRKKTLKSQFVKHGEKLI